MFSSTRHESTTRSFPHKAYALIIIMALTVIRKCRKNTISHLLSAIVIPANDIPKSMFVSLTNKAKSLTNKRHRGILVYTADSGN